MKAKTLGAAAGQLGGWAVMVFFVVLLSFIFSFLGTLCCALLAGMMLGAMKTYRWASIPISLVFPAVVWLLLRSMKSDLPDGRINLVALLCLGVFWVSFFLAGALVSHETRNRPPLGASQAEPVGPSASRGPEPGEQAGSGRPAVPAAAAACREARAELSLAQLQGTWRRQGAEGNGEAQEQVLEIKEDHLVVSALDATGGVCWVAEGKVRFEQTGRAWKPNATATDPPGR